MSGEGRGEIKGSLGWECTPAIRSPSPTGRGETNDESTLSSITWNIWKKKRRGGGVEKSKSQSYTLDVSCMAYAVS